MASRPPSATSVGQTLKSKQHAEDDGALPPREDKTPMTPPATSPSSPKTDKQQDDAIGDTAEIPARAGFDLAAMRAVIDGIEQGKEGRHDLTRPTRIEISPPPPPSAISAERPQYTYPPMTKSPNITPTIEQFSSTQSPTASAVSELTPASASPRSLRDIHDALPSESEEDDARSPGPSSSPSLSGFPSRSHPTGDSAFSFTGYDGGLGSTPEFTDEDAYGGSGGVGTRFGNPFHPTQFPAVGPTGSSPSNVANASLAVPDGWSFQTYSGDVSGAKKPSSVFAANPWDS